MAREVFAYACDLCNRPFISEDNKMAKRAAEEHEKMPMKGISKSLDGLVVAGPRHKTYHVCIKSDEVDYIHNTLYEWKVYNSRSLTFIPPINLSDITRNKSLLEALHRFESFIGKGNGVKADDARWHLYRSSCDSFDSERYPAFQEISEKELAHVGKELKKKYPSLYDKTTFKRKAYPRRR